MVQLITLTSDGCPVIVREGVKVAEERCKTDTGDAYQITIRWAVVTIPILVGQVDVATVREEAARLNLVPHRGCLN